LEWGEVGFDKGVVLEAREPITVLKFGGRDEEIGSEWGGRGEEGRLAWGMGELRVTVGRNIGDMGGDGLSAELSINIMSRAVSLLSVLSSSLEEVNQAN